MKNFCELGVKTPHILLPADAPINEWAVIACDQYTQDKEYWEKVQNIVRGKKSTYELILPEIYLEKAKDSSYINQIHAAMEKYIDEKIFLPEMENFIYIERTSNYNRTRCGLMIELDLEKYDWQPGTLAPVRATEATIPERIPPRKGIRKGAPLELPHIMLLANDKERLLIEEAGKLAKKSAPIYEGDLMMNAGSIKGWKIDEPDGEKIFSAIKKLAEKNTDANGNVFLFAVGDGNHSLATAKAVWDDYKKTIPESKWENSRVRYALVELVNLYDEGLTFEPIHRVLFGADAEKLIAEIAKKLGGKISDCETFEKMAKAVEASNATFGFTFTENGKTFYKLMETEISGLAVAQFQPSLDNVLAENSASVSANAGKKIEIDFIHGTEEVERLGKQENAVAILLPPIAKDSFFNTINECGVLPRKSFSMGEADEKRFYLECRKLF